MAGRMDWTKLLCSKRYGTDKAEPAGDPRSPFERDIDRIVFSPHFRRLGRKTQVHPLNENDHVHTRLGHSLEAASVGRSLGLFVGTFLRERGELPEDVAREHLGQIVQAACLAHDIGNPPFGHNGELAIKEWFARNPDKYAQLSVAQRLDFTRFDGNAMAWRIMVSTGFDEGEGGMRPTFAVLGALLKYPHTSRHAVKDKFGAFLSEAAALDEAAAALGLPETAPGAYARHPLAFLTEAADDICYRIIDLEDAIEVGILDQHFVLERFKDCLDLSRADYDRLAAAPFRRRSGELRAKLMGAAIKEAADAFGALYEPIMHAELSGGLLDNAAGPVSRALLEVYGEASKQIFYSRRKVELEIGAQRSLGILLDTFCTPAVSFCTGETHETRSWIEAIIGPERIARLDPDRGDCFYASLLLILDYITGMSDQYATRMCRRFIGLGE